MIYRETFQKPKEQDFFFSWLVQRRLAKPIVYLLKNSSITPNQISVISILVGFVGVFYLFFGGYQPDLRSGSQKLPVRLWREQCVSVNSA